MVIALFALAPVGGGIELSIAAERGAVTLLIIVLLALYLRGDAKARQMQTQYAEQSEILEAILANISHGILMIGADDRVLAANPVVVAQFDFPAELVAGRPMMSDVLHWLWSLANTRIAATISPAGCNTSEPRYGPTRFLSISGPPERCWRCAAGCCPTAPLCVPIPTSPSASRSPGVAVPAVHASRQLNHAQIRRHRSWPLDFPQARRVAAGG